MHSCILIGEDSLLIQCGDILLSHNFWIERVVSPSRNVQNWAHKNNIHWVSSIKELISSPLNTVDYIFSIVNSFILNSSVLNLANHATINYHNSLLPKYAGLNATTWALINQEKEHGITWHIVTEGIDEGDIVKQARFPIYKDDTAFTLNLRCYEQSIQAFSDLVLDIIHGNLLLTKQDLKERSYFGQTKMLPTFGFIDWENNSAEFIANLCNATALGHYNNNVGFVKLHLANDYVIIPEVAIITHDELDQCSGTIIDIQEDALIVSTTSDAIKINKILSKTGESISIALFITQFNIHIGMEFKSIQNDTEYFKALHTHASKNERYWVKQFVELNEHETFTPPSLKKDNSGLQSLEQPINISPYLSSLDEPQKKSLILTAILIYLYRLNDYEKTSASLVYHEFQQLNNPCGTLFSAFLPLVLQWTEEMDLESLITDVENILNKQGQSHTFFTDIVARHPDLDNKHLASNIIINMVGGSESINLPQETLLYFHYDILNQNILVSHGIDEQYHSGLLLQTLNNLPLHIENILNYLITKPHIKVSEFCFLTASERDVLLNQWGKGDEYPLPHYSIYSLFETAANNTPDAPAIVTSGEIISYNQLSQLADKVNYYIQARELAPQTLIGLYSPRSVEMIAAILGIIKSNCVYVPLDTRYPLLKIETIASEAQLNHILTTELLQNELQNYFTGKQILECHSLDLIMSDNISQNTPLMPLPSTSSLAYVMFTSGTTGTPKGVVVTQKNVINYCLWFTKTTNFSPSSVIDFSSSIAFDLSIPCTLAPLLIGASIALCTESVKSNPELYLRHLIDHKVTHTELTPGYVEMMLHYPNLVKNLTDLNYLMLGADVVHTQEVKKWLELCPHHQVVNEYGPTEATVSVTSYFVNSKDYTLEASVPIGRPAFNSTAYLLDKRRNLCPIGMKGELHIGGAQVTNGYLGKPTLTEAKFIPLALNNVLEILYKTGDLVAWLNKGHMQFFGRNDFQVKIQGYRIELPAIESALLQMDAIEQAVVLVRKGHFKEKYLRAYIVLKDESLNINTIRKFISTHLPNYMIPKEFCRTSEIPLKENEKIDFQALEKQEFTLLGFEHEVNEELTESEKIITDIWNKAFNVNDINHHDDFFALGGDSLLALHIINALKHHFQLDIPLAYLFEYPTIALLSKGIDDRLDTQNNTCICKNTKPNWIIKLSTGTHETPLFLIHPVGGTVFWYKQLAAHLDGTYTIYGIQDASVDGDERRFESIEEMASFYIEAISEVYQGTNFALAGASFGATVAFEMAKQLISSNNTIQYLGLFDGWTKYPASLMNQNTVPLLKYNENTSESLVQLEEYRKNLLLKYTFSPIETNAILYKAKELWNDFFVVDQNDNGWSSTIKGNFSTHLIDGNHETMLFKSNAKSLAHQIHLDIKDRLM